jgi:hypothetical protein
MVLDSVPVWVQIYDVPWDKQNKAWGMKVGNGLGRAVEVDAPADEQDMNEFLRVHVELPYDRRLQTQITTGVGGKPGRVTGYKLKYERVPYFFSHCGFMGHKKEVCEKKRRGVPSLDYEAYELRCSPFKKFDNRAHFIPPQGQASARRGLSFSSFGSAESRKTWQNTRPEPSGEVNKTRTGSMQAEREEELEDMPPLEDIIPGFGGGTVPVGLHDVFDESEAREEEVDQALLSKVNAMQVDIVNKESSAATNGRATGPFI